MLFRRVQYIRITNAKYLHIDHDFSIDHQSTSNDRLKPVMTTGLANMHIDRSIANLAWFVESRLASHHFCLFL